MGVYKRGNSWYLDFYYKGQRYTECIGAVSKTVAKEIQATKKAEVIKGEYLPNKEKADILFEKMAEIYTEYYKANRKTNSYTRYVAVALKPLLKHFGGKKLSEISSFLIEKYKRTRKEEIQKGEGKISINRELSCFKNMFNKAIEWGKFIGENPVKKVKKYKEDNGRIRFLTEEEEERLLANCAPHLKPLVITAIHTGLRKSELLSLTWDNVDFKSRLISVEAAYSKNGEARKVPMNNSLTEILRMVKKDSQNNRVFTLSDGRPFLDFKTAFKSALKRAGIKNFTFHDLRHTFASRLVMAGVDLPTTKELMGHKDIKMTLRYSHLSADHKKQAVALLDKKLSTESQQFSQHPKFLSFKLVSREGLEPSTY